MKLLNYSVLGLCGAFLLCGCASYRVKPLRKLTKETAQYVEKKDDIEVCASRMSDQEFKDYANGAYLSKKSQLVPVLITVYNKSRNTFVWSIDRITCFPCPADDVVLALRYHYFSALAAGITAGLATVAVGGLMLEGSYYEYALFNLGLFTVFPGSILASIAGTISMVIHHKNFERALIADLREKMLSRVDLMPGDVISKLIIAKDDQFVEPFKMGIKQVGMNKITEFAVALPPLAANKK
jgi:hypothetical protein